MRPPRSAPGVAAGEAWTVLVVGAHGEAVRRFRVQRGLPRRLALAAALLAAAIAATGVHYASLLRVARVNRALRDENAGLRERLSSVAEQVARVAATLDDVERLDGRLREANAPLEPGRPRARPPDEPGPPPGTAGAPAASRGPAAPAAPSTAPATSSAAPAAAPPSAPPGAGSAAGNGKASGAGLGDLKERAERGAGELRAALAYFDAQQALLDRVPAVWPARGYVTSDFGSRLDPYTAERAIHRGLDIAARPGDPVRAPSDAVVAFAGVEHGYGNVVVLDHGGGLQTRFGHLSRILVRRGERVTKGEQVGAVGSTGRSTGPHLHYEVRVDGTAENPRKFLME